MSEESAGSAAAAPTATAPAPASAPVSRWRHRPFIEIVAVAMLSVTAILTAWCGFQASKWSGERAIAFAEAFAARVEATDADSQAREARVVDLIIYAEWVTATAQGDTALAEDIAAQLHAALPGRLRRLGGRRAGRARPVRDGRVRATGQRGERRSARPTPTRTRRKRSGTASGATTTRC